jgi:hypothetical protein
MSKPDHVPECGYGFRFEIWRALRDALDPRMGNERWVVRSSLAQRTSVFALLSLSLRNQSQRRKKKKNTRTFVIRPTRAFVDSLL